jgi:hypothetical protein
VRARLVHLDNINLCKQPYFHTLMPLTLSIDFFIYDFPMTRLAQTNNPIATKNSTKPGGLTTSEALAMGLPMIVHSPIPDQEEHNADYLLEEGAALKAIDDGGMEFRLKALLADSTRLARMRMRARASGRAFAGHDVLEIVLTEKA